MDPDQTALLGAVWSRSTLSAYMQNVSLKSLQEDAADDISRQHFQMQIFLALLGLSYVYEFHFICIKEINLSQGNQSGAITHAKINT